MTKISRILWKRFAYFQDFKTFYKNKLNFLTRIFRILIFHKPSLGSREIPQTNVGPIGSAVLTFIGYKQTQTNKQTDKQAKFIYR